MSVRGRVEEDGQGNDNINIPLLLSQVIYSYSGVTLPALLNRCRHNGADRNALDRRTGIVRLRGLSISINLQGPGILIDLLHAHFPVLIDGPLKQDTVNVPDARPLQFLAAEVVEFAKGL